MYVLLAFSQTKPDTTGSRIDLFFNSPDIALPLLYNAAIARAAEMERLDAEEQLAEEQIKLSKRQILSGISIGGGYNWGSRFRYSDAEQISNPWNPFVLPVQAFYNVGVNVGFPLLSIVNRKSQIKASMLALKQVKTDQKLTEREIREQIITLYQELVLSRKVMENAQDAFQSAKVSKQIAEKRFRQGELQVDEQMQVLDFYSKAGLALEQAKSVYLTNYLLLEERLGMTIYNLMNDAK
ncbi:Outer membrane efflux protein [Pontibacter akesuensis]|uniref:Outer membrane efflux protein n=2 Tax=Pontibacter akesuensis TaxID=388950 RepID=A0A1I7GH64_9BACT|nr:Outer membrane efflux protein [Pontibacter akesuensis]